jgi:hypothetical protein
MKNPPLLKMAIWTLSILFITAGMSAAQILNNNELEFTGKITDVMPNGDGGGTLFVDVDATDLRVLVNSSTEIRKGEDEVAMADLKKDDVIRVEGKFSSSGILASSIEVLTEEEPDNGFSIRGHITGVQDSGDKLLVSLLGITIEVTGDLKPEWESGLKIGVNVKIRGTVVDKTWNATEIKLVSKEKKQGAVRFEGEVTAIDDISATERRITVRVESTPSANQIVYQNSETEVNGDVEVGSFVEVKGKLNTDFSVTAKEITVVGALEIKPDERKIKIGQEATFTVKLRETATGDVTVTLGKTDPDGAITLSATSITVPAGSKTADFKVTGMALGEATITAKLESGDQATAVVRVGMYSEEDNERPDAAMRVVFAPDHIKMGTNDARDVILLVMPPQKAQVKVELKSIKGLVEATVRRELGNGVAVYKVTIKSGSAAGPDAVTAALTDFTEVPVAELAVEIQDKKK